MPETTDPAAFLDAVRKRSEVKLWPAINQAGVSNPAVQAMMASGSDVPILLAALDAVRVRHRPGMRVRFGCACNDHYATGLDPSCQVCEPEVRQQICAECRDENGEAALWPCPTVRDITVALAGKDGS
jgi:hypothetical protein